MVESVKRIATTLKVYAVSSGSFEFSSSYLCKESKVLTNGDKNRMRRDGKRGKSSLRQGKPFFQVQKGGGSVGKLVMLNIFKGEVANFL